VLPRKALGVVALLLLEALALLLLLVPLLLVLLLLFELLPLLVADRWEPDALLLL
jgi:hypothetical protein